MGGPFTILVRDSAGAVYPHQLGPGVYTIGRRSDCDLSIPEADVSRNHAKLTLEAGEFVIEDLGSSAGTYLGGERLAGPRRLAYPQTVQVGSAQMFVSDQPLPARQMPPAPESGGVEGKVRITVSMDATASRAPTQGVAEQMARRLEMLYTLPLQFAAEPDLRKLFKLVLSRVMELIPGANRGALLVIDPASSSLVLRASVPEDNPPISRTLIKRAANEKQGFIWGEEQAGADMALSIVNLHIRTGMYAPMLWKGRTMGVICVDNPQHRGAFTHEDLQFLISVANYAAAAIANQLLQDDIEQNNRTLQNLLANFSPKLRDKLLQKSREGRLQPGGEKSNVTILMSDLRGFTRASSSLGAEDVVDMLNDYFSVLGDIVFQHDGTIDKFIGDAILAVFGSPEADENHALNAARCAMAMQSAIAAINERRRAEGRPNCDLGVGIHTGEVLHGFIGADERLEFTVIGDTVNKAARFCDGAAAGQIVMGPRTHEAVKGTLRTEPRTIATKHEGPIEAYVIL